MIRRLKYHEIDFEKYSQCLNTSEQKNWYAQKHILDHLSGNWQILILDDYKAVMPIHFHRKFGVNFVHMPLFCQQLGVFSETDDAEINEDFLKFFRKKFRIFLYNFNDKNNFLTPLEKRKNYKISVSEYSFLRRKKYFKGRKSTVKTAQYLSCREFFLSSDIEDFISRNFKGLAENDDYEKLRDYIRYLAQMKSIRIFGALHGEELTNLAVLIEGDAEVSLLALINSEKYTFHNGSSFLIDQIVQRFTTEKKINFMGGNIRGIEVFFKSFGADLLEYSTLENTFLMRFI
ncbi:hypothetical protein [Chryseobacterium foetidum]|uniref:hypothetical protein n=1 Tax=Chryseobacterium foetidum TaxID=2951057 RepID=UPI0021C92B4B|nr:hypothetical protein [Chryseobacterium foetidum]